MTISVVSALLSDPLLIWTGLSLLVISLFTIPVFFSKVNDIVISLVYFTVYLVLELRSYILPSTKSLEMTEELVESEEKKAEKQIPISPETAAAEEIAKQGQLDKILAIIQDLIIHPSKILKLLRDDFSLKAKKEEGPGYIIKFRFKFLFFMLATLAAALVLFVPAVSTLGPGALCALLMSWGIKYAIAQYAAVVITGGLIDSLRTSAVGLMLLFNKVRGKSWEHEPLSPSEIELRKPLLPREPPLSTTAKYQVKLASAPTDATTESKSVIFTLTCPNCNEDLVIEDTSTVKIEKNESPRSTHALPQQGAPITRAIQQLGRGKEPGLSQELSQKEGGEKLQLSPR